MPADPRDAALQAWTQAGEAMARGFLQAFAGQQTAASQPVPVDWAALGEQSTRLREAWQAKHAELWQAMLARKAGDPPVVVAAPESGDRRFDNPLWTSSPVYDYLRQAYLINAEFLGKAAEAVTVPEGLPKNRLRFLTRQMADALAPSNFIATNPEFVQQALDTQGESIRRGIENLVADLDKGRISMTDESAFEVGRNLAVTPGAVVFENELMQLIQYSPLTEKVAKRPLVMVPPCINKYYILDLQPENSFVRYAVEQGQTVFLVSWRNPKAELGHLAWDDYVERGALTALLTAKAIARVPQVNALGFCVGGTILASALAVAKAKGEDLAASLTLLTTFLDFSDPGEIGCFVDEASVAARENTIGKGGLLTARELSSVFSALRANDLIWQYVVANYLKGGKPPAFDLLYWNSDSTNLPGPFAAWYLRNMYLENNLRHPGKLTVCGTPVDLGRLDMPAFVLASREDHIVPWKSSYLSRGLLGGPTTFVLGASGHIAGVINPAAKNKRSHWISDGAAAGADEWLAAATEMKGSWWPRWSEWLRAFAGGEVKARQGLGSKAHPPIEPAPGRYVKEKA
jgi:polyhydroxyalkanoate synthase